MKIALYVNSLDDEYQLSLFRSIQKRTRDRGIELLCIQGEHMTPPAEDDVFFPSRSFIGVDGILLLTSAMLDTLTTEVSNHLAEQLSDIPAVSIGTSIPGINSIIIRGKQSMEQLMDHLIQHHQYRRYLFLSGPENHQDNIVRREVFEDALNTARQQFPDISYDIIYGNYNENAATNAMNRYFEEHRATPPDVVVAANDEMALGALKVLRTRTDYRWQHTAVTGFDDTDRAQMSQPPLTTIRQPYDKAATQAVDTLYTLIMKQKTDELIKINATLQVRNSCGCSGSTEGEKPDPAEEFIKTKATLNSIQTQTVKSTRYMRNTSILTQTLNTANSLEQFGPAIRGFLDNLDIKDFYMVLFSEPVLELPEKGKLIYKKMSGTEETEQDLIANPEEVDLKAFFESTMEEGDDGSVTRCLRYLRAGQDMYGLIVYDADDLAQPLICNTSPFIASTLQRFRLTELEKARADELEREVEKRTRDLRKTHKLLEEESQRRIQVEAEVLKISELERMRFSMDLHDDICQRLAGLSMKCRGIAGSGGGKQKIEELSEQIDETLSRTRQYAHDSYPVELNTLGLNQAMDNLCHSYQKQTNYNLVYTWKAPDPVGISQNAQIALFRILQEALHNIVKHAKATKVRVSISTKGWKGAEKLVVKIEDNGQGLEASRNSKRKESSGLGLRSMQYRADQIGAEFSITSPESGGTKIELVLPLKDHQA